MKGEELKQAMRKAFFEVPDDIKNEQQLADYMAGKAF